MEREIIRVEPFDTNFEKWGAPVSVCTRAGNMVFMSGMPPFDPDTGELLQHAPFERQAERILEQMKTALEAAGSDLDHVLNDAGTGIHLKHDATVLAHAVQLSLRAPPQSVGCEIGIGAEITGVSSSHQIDHCDQMARVWVLAVDAIAVDRDVSGLMVYRYG